MTKFVQTTHGTYLSLARVATARPIDGNPDVLKVTTRDGDDYQVETEHWTQAIANDAVSAAFGIRMIDAARYLKSPTIGCTVIAWRVGGYDEYPAGVTLDSVAETHGDPEDVAYLFPDGHVENCEGCWPSLDDFTAHHQKRHAKWRGRNAKAQAAE